jgi:heme A synthase
MQNQGYQEGEQQFSTMAPQQHPSSSLVSRMSGLGVALSFLLIIWRDLELYGMADQFASSLMRTVTVVPVVMLMLANATGFLVLLNTGGKVYCGFLLYSPSNARLHRYTRDS